MSITKLFAAAVTCSNRSSGEIGVVSIGGLSLEPAEWSEWLVEPDCLLGLVSGDSQSID
jgi:hypothetical protein